MIQEALKNIPRLDLFKPGDMLRRRERVFKLFIKADFKARESLSPGKNNKGGTNLTVWQKCPKYTLLKTTWYEINFQEFFEFKIQLNKVKHNHNFIVIEHNCI
ncbi:unnamed protein product [Lepidochelys kempii]